MKPHAANQRGLTLLSLLISMSIIMILGYLLLSNSGIGGGGGKGPRSKKEKAMGAQCQATMSALSISVQTRLATNQPVESIDALVEEDPSLKSNIYNDNLWAKDGAPLLEYTGDDSFIITGYCVDGNLYTYDSADGGIVSEQWR